MKDSDIRDQMREEMKRDKEDFDRIFDEQVAAYLVDAGFTEKGKSLYRFRLNVTVGFMRMGGRMMWPGSASWVLAVRHPYVIKHTPEEPPGRQSLYKEEFPFQFDPMRLATGKDDLHYDPSYIYDGNYGQFEYAGDSPENLERDMILLRRYILDEFMPWAESITAEDAVEELTTRGRGMWAENFWIEQYRKQIEAEQDEALKP